MAVDPNTLEILDELALLEPATAPHMIAMYKNKIAIYIPADVKVYRYFWDPINKKLSKDSWEVEAMEEGQTAAACPSVIGNWIAIQTNGVGSDVKASSLVVVNVDDATRKNVIYPFGQLKKDEWSFAMPKPITDLENNIVYSADMGMKKVAGINLDQETGELKIKFIVDDITTTFQPLIGQKDKRVLLLTNMKQNVDIESIKTAFFTNNYKEQLTWRDAQQERYLQNQIFLNHLFLMV